jgi:hypothetical protein
VPASEVIGKGDYFRFSLRDSLSLEASFVQVCCVFPLRVFQLSVKFIEFRVSCFVFRVWE